MKIKPETLDAHLRERLLRAYLISGDEPLLTGEAADAVRQCARAQGFTERDVHFMDRGGDWDAVRTSAASMSLFAEKRIVEVRLPTGRPGVTGARVLKSVVESAGPDTVVLILTGRLDREASASEWVRAVETQGGWVALWPVPAGQLLQWLEGRCRRLGLLPDREALALLAEHTEGNLLASVQELTKLALLAPQGRIDAQAVLASCTDSARFDVGELDRALSQGDCTRALRVLAGLRAEEAELPLVLWAVIKAMHAVTAVQSDVPQPPGFSGTPASGRDVGGGAGQAQGRDFSGGTAQGPGRDFSGAATPGRGVGGGTGQAQGRDFSGGTARGPGRDLSGAAVPARSFGGYGGPSARPRTLSVSFATLAQRAARADGMAKGRLRGNAWDELALLAAQLCGRPGLPAVTNGFT